MVTNVHSCLCFIDIVHNIVPVSFSQANYSVLEGERSTTITLKTLADHTFSFSVTVSTRDGTASCELCCIWLLLVAM